MIHTPVLIVGGSLVGLSASLFLSWHRVPHVLVEKHSGSSPHPRAMGFTETTLEHFRAVGIAERIPQTPSGVRPRRVTVESLSGRWLEERPWTPGRASAPRRSSSPCTGAAIAQDRLEPILRAAAIERGAQVRLETEVLDLAPFDGGVIAYARDRRTGDVHDIHADYVIAADGAASPIRELLNIRRSGVGHLRLLRSVLFHCPGADAFLERGAQQFTIEQPDFRAFLTTYGDSRWVLMLEGDRERSPHELREAIRQALGSDMPFDIVTTGQWEMAGRIADRYRSGRIFLAGDAAHQLPPTRGGFGANTGIDDVWNLAWKLQRVIAGTSVDALLDTYDAERRPIGWLRHQQTFSRPDYAGWVDATFKPDALFGDEAMEFGQLVRSSAIVSADDPLPAAADILRWAGQPGTRAPHAWLTKDGAVISSLDLFRGDFVVLSAEAAWLHAAALLRLHAVHVDEEVTFPEHQPFHVTFGIGKRGAVLVRPDGIVAWRCTGDPMARDATDVLAEAFARAAAAPRSLG